MVRVGPEDIHTVVLLRDDAAFIFRKLNAGINTIFYFFLQGTVTYVSLNSTGANSSWAFESPTRNITNATYTGYYYCKYDSDVSSSYAVAAFVFLAIAQVTVMGLTKCLCFDGEHKPGSTKSCAIVSFILLW